MLKCCAVVCLKSALFSAAEAKTARDLWKRLERLLLVETDFQLIC